MKLEHFALNVNDPQAMAAWYVAHLNMEIVRADAESPYITFLRSKEGGVMIELYNNPAGPILDFGDIHPLSFHIAFLAENMGSDVARLTAAGAKTIVSPTTQPNGDILAFLRDPWGNVVQLVQRVVPFG